MSFRKRHEFEVYKLNKRVKVMCKKCGSVHYTDEDCKQVGSVLRTDEIKKPEG